MMKVNTAILLLVALMGFAVPANAVLIDRGTGMIYDTELGITWLQDANYAQTSGYDADGRMNWSDSMAWANGLSYDGLNDWRLPDALPVNGVSYNHNLSYDGTTDYSWNITSSNSELSHLFYVGLGNTGWYDTSGNETYRFEMYGAPVENPGPFINIQPNFYWSGTDYDGSDNILTFHFDRGIQDHGRDFIEGYAWAVRDGDYGPSVSTTQTYLTDYLTLGDTFTFDYWWDMGIEPTGFNLDALFFNGTGWETFGWELNFDGSSDGWETASFWVPAWARGTETQIMFRAFDLGQETDPTVYLRNIASNSAPVPEPATILLLGTGFIGLAGALRKR